MASSAMFLDGPLIGTTKVFDRSIPPAMVYCQRAVVDPHASLDAPKRFEQITYKREPNIFGGGPEWLYMTEDSLETADTSPEK